MFRPFYNQQKFQFRNPLSSASLSTVNDTQSLPQTPDGGVPPATAIAYPHETAVTGSFMGRGAHSYDMLHTGLSAGNAESFDLFKQSKDLTRLPVLLPPGGPQENGGLPQTSSPVSGPCLAEMQGESSPTSPCRPRRFACDFGHAEPGNPVRGNHSDIPLSPTPVRTSTSGEDGLGSVDSSMCCTLFREVGLMVGMTDLDDHPFRGSPVLSESPPSTMDYHRRSTARSLSLLIPPRKLRTASGTQLIKLPIGSPKNLNHPAAPLTYASLASRPADSARNKRRFCSLDVIQEQVIAREPDRNPIPRQRGSEKVGHKHWDEHLLADDEVDLRSNKDTANIHTNPREPVCLPAAQISALDKFSSGLSRLRAHSPYQLQKAHSVTGASIRPPKSSEIKRRSSLSPVVCSVAENRDPVRQITMVANGRRFPPPPGLPQPLRSVTGDAASAVAAFPTATPPRQSHIRSSGAPMKSLVEMNVSTPRQGPPRQPRPNSVRKQPSDSKIKKFVRSAGRLRRRISFWGRRPPNSSPPTPHTPATSRHYYYSVPIGF